MELSVLKSPDLVVALDIGSTNSGYAWQWRSNFDKNRSNIEFNDNWGTASPRLRKTTTCLLLNEGKAIDSFGQLAEKRFCNECDKAGGQSLEGKWYFFKGFKMILYDQDSPGKLQVDDHFGQPMPLFDVMSNFIQAMREHFLNLMRTKQQKPNLNKILWVITVPAIWSDASKKFMSEAAEKAGIQRKNLLIAHEPEAAAIHCMHIPCEERYAMGSFGEKGDTFLTADLGGGTTDVLVVNVREDGTLEEISLGSGGLVGGQDVNNAFFQACYDAFKGDGWFEVTKKSDAGELLDMENDFESNKVTIGLDSSRDDELTLSMPDVFRSLLQNDKIQLKESGGTRFSIKKGKMYFKSEFIRESLFNETINRMLKFLKEILQREQVQSVKNIVLVGGFTESPIVVERIKQFLDENFPNRNVIVPTSPLSAVLSGAVLYGHNPLIFRSRICRATYGVETHIRFDPKLHKEDKKWRNKVTEVEYCKDIFDIHVEKGTAVTLGETLPSQIYTPLYKNKTSISLPIYRSTAQHITGTLYTTDDHCKKLGEIKVEMPDTTGDTSRDVTVTMIYGGTELDVTAKDETSGKEFKATMRFDIP